LHKNGHRPSGIQYWHCCECGKNFQLEYLYNAHKPGVKEQITELTLNSSGVRDISRVLKINKNTVISELKKKEMPKVNPYMQTDPAQSGEDLEVEMVCEAEMDEFWSFVKNKGNQRWTWYAIDRHSGRILAWHNGKRDDKDFLVLWAMLSKFSVKCYCTDDWGAYSRYIPVDKHRVGKDKTWKIERKNLNFRTHIKRLHRKTICFSRNEQIHDNVIGMYINRYCFKTGLFSDAA